VRRVLLFLTVLAILGGCAGAPQNGNPDWVNRLIVGFQSAPVANPPQSVWRYDYKGQTVYYTPPQCCDQFSILYDTSGVRMCAPDGGIAGHGDGKCPDFLTERKNGELIWKDSRGAP
jgi:hypothetical protein